MRWPKWSIATPDSGDFLPMVIGCLLLFISAPGFLLVWLIPDHNSGVIGVPLMVILGTGIVIGLGFVVFGIRITAMPGSRLYRITHGRIFSH